VKEIMACNNKEEVLIKLNLKMDDLKRMQKNS